MMFCLLLTLKQIIDRVQMQMAARRTVLRAASQWTEYIRSLTAPCILYFLLRTLQMYNTEEITV